MAINLLDIQPHKVSRDLRGYTVMFYGSPKSRQDIYSITLH